MVIGNKISELRKKFNYTQEQLAEKIGVTRQTLSNWESNITSPDLNQACILCNLLKVNISDLIDNNVEIEVKESNNILQKLINKEIEIEFDDFCELDLIGQKVKVLDVNESFIKVQYGKNNTVTLIDLDFVESIKLVEE